jgi:uncharacterized membrane protein
MLIGLLVPLGAFAMIFGIFYVAISSRNRERMSLIEKGADPALFESIKRSSEVRTMKLGLFLLGIGIGIVVANVFVTSNLMEEDAAYPAMILVFGGLALITAHFLTRNQEKRID